MLASARRLSHKRLFSFKPRGAVKTAPYEAGVNGRLQVPHMCGTYNSVGQLQRVHPPAALGGNEADGLRKRVCRDVGAFPAPAVKRFIIEL